jgi:hypothetical protein
LKKRKLFYHFASKKSPVQKSLVFKKPRKWKFDWRAFIYNLN